MTLRVYASRAVLSSIIGILAMGIALPAWAESTLIETVTVTAERRAEDVQKVPLTITALSGAQLDQSGVKSTMDLQNKTPGFVIKTNTAFGQPYIRGIGSDLVSVSSDSSVAIFVDDVYQARPVGSIQNFYDVDRVEIVKGPQSTLFGRNVTGGAVRIFSRTPTNEFSADVDASYGNFNAVRVRGDVNIPLSDDFALRIAGMSSTRDGYSKNIFLNTRIDDLDVQAGRVSLAYRPTEDFSWVVIADYMTQSDSNGLANWPDPTCCVNLGIIMGGTVPANRREVTHDVADFEHGTSLGVSSRITWDTGIGTLTAITGYRHVGLKEGLDLDGTDFAFANNFPVLRSNTFTQDVQLSSAPSDGFEWVLGANYLNEGGFQELNIGIPAFMASSRPGASVTTNAYAAYVQGTYHFNDRLKLVAGLRYSYETRTQHYLQTIVDPLAALGGSAVLVDNTSKSWDSATPSFTLQYDLSEDVMFYASASEGFKAGGFNSTAFQSAFNPEKLWAFEIGEKGTFWQGRAQLNGSLFWYDYKNIQVNTLAPGAPTGAFPIVINAASATIRGVDLGLILVPVDALTLEGNFEYLDAHFDDFISVDPNNPLADPNRAGQQMPQGPKFSVNFAASYTFPVASHGNLTLRGELHHQSLVYFNSFADPVTAQKPYSVFNARAQFDITDSNWYVAVFGNNLTDKLYAQTMIRQDPLVGLLYQWAPPRTFGIEIGAHFD
ncbi:MAG: TonB-dependent receptor [Rhizomicrobium sp.]